MKTDTTAQTPAEETVQIHVPPLPKKHRWECGTYRGTSVETEAAARKGLGGHFRRMRTHGHFGARIISTITPQEVPIELKSRRIFFSPGDPRPVKENVLRIRQSSLGDSIVLEIDHAAIHLELLVAGGYDTHLLARRLVQVIRAGPQIQPAGRMPHTTMAPAAPAVHAAPEGA